MNLLQSKILFSLSLLAASSAWGSSQQATPSVSVSLPCDVQNPKKTLSDWADFSRYREDNATLDPTAVGQKRVVFFGSSTTDNWGRRFDSSFFPGKPYINRGISGETTPQMLLRFQQDVVALRPAAVVFLGGTNDVAGNSGPMTLEMTENNISAMAAIAQANGIKMMPGVTTPGQGVSLEQMRSARSKPARPQRLGKELRRGASTRIRGLLCCACRT